MQILFLSNWFPYPITNGSTLRIFQLVRGLANHHNVHLVSFVDPGVSIEYGAPEINKYCQGIRIVPQKTYRPNSLRALGGIFSLQPRSLIDTFSQQMYQKINDTVQQIAPDLVIASELSMAAYRNSFNKIPALFDDLEVGMLDNRITEASSSYLRLRHSLTPLKQRYYLRKLLRNFRACTLVSEIELTLAKNLVPDYEKFVVIPNCVDLTCYQDIPNLPHSNRLIFTGSFRFSANYQAMVWFLEEIYPIIFKVIPQVELLITGDHANLPLPPAQNVTKTGYVGDVRPLIAGAIVSIVPLRYGGGTRLKILESMTLGTPIVSTHKGAEGLDVEDGVHILLADDPNDFANAVIQLFRNRNLARRLSYNARQLVEDKYNWSMVMPRFLKLVEECAGNSQIAEQ